MKTGDLKRNLGSLRKARQVLECECRCYESENKHLMPSRESGHDIMQVHCHADAHQPGANEKDVLEAFAGAARATMEAARQGLRALEPLDSCFGCYLDQQDGMNKVNDMITNFKPLLVMAGFPCTDYVLRLQRPCQLPRPSRSTTRQVEGEPPHAAQHDEQPTSAARRRTTLPPAEPAQLPALGPRAGENPGFIAGSHQRHRAPMPVWARRRRQHPDPRTHEVAHQRP